MTARLRTVRERIGEERGYSLIEMLTVMVIMTIVFAGLTNIFVSGSNAEADMNRRFQAQQDARVAMDRLRRDVHCAASITPTTPTTSIDLKPPAAGGGCGDISWCTVAMPNSTTRWSLYRQVGTTCGSTGTKLADYLTTANPFPTYDAGVHTQPQLASLSIDIPIQVKAGTLGVGQYELRDTIFLRNSTRQ